MEADIEGGTRFEQMPVREPMTELEQKHAKKVEQVREYMKRDPEGLEQFVKERSVTRGAPKLGESPEPEMKMEESRGRDQEPEL